MSTFVLRFKGAEQYARASLVPLLNAYPAAFFRERETTVFEVTADEQTQQKLAALAQWQVYAAH